MNTALLKAKLDNFFANVSPEYLVREFEKMGYSFIDVNIDWEQPEVYTLMNEPCTSSNFITRIFKRSGQANTLKKITSEYSEVIFCFKIAS